MFIAYNVERNFNVMKYDGPKDHASMKSFITFMKPHHSLKRLIEVTSENFNKTTSEGNTIVRFYDNECPICQSTIDGWHDLVHDVITSGDDIKMAEINCRKNQAKCYEQDVHSVPSIVFYMSGAKVDIFRGSHSCLSDLRQFLAFLRDKPPYELPPPYMNYVTKLQMDSFDTTTSSEKYVFVKFFMPWCEFCKALSPIWEQLALKMYRKRLVVIAEVNCSEQMVICQDNQIRGYPTMLLFHNGKMLDMYTGAHDVTTLHDYVFSMTGTRRHHLHHGEL